MKNDCKLKRDFGWCGIWEKRNCECLGCKYHIVDHNKKVLTDATEIQSAGRAGKKK